MDSVSTLYKAALKKWGRAAQVEMIVEECSELIKAIQKEKRNKTPETTGDVIGEIADVEIMLEQARILYGPERVDRVKHEKLKRLAERLRDGKQPVK